MLKSKIENQYSKHNKSRICQGDIVKDFKFTTVTTESNVMENGFPYVVVFSQDCDLANNKDKEDNGKIINNQFLVNILFLPAFPAKILREGKHLEDFCERLQDRLNTQRWKTIKTNNNSRYHFLNGYSNFQIPDLVIDFKLYFTSSVDNFINMHNTNYLSTVNELFRERMVQRFCDYFNRIALPEI